MATVQQVPAGEENKYPEAKTVLERVNCTLEYPQPYRRTNKRNLRNKRQASRYRTQPVTFAEIKEVDEENVDESYSKKKQKEIGGVKSTDGKSETKDPKITADELRQQFAEFSRTMEVIVTNKCWDQKADRRKIISKQDGGNERPKSVTLRPEALQQQLNNWSKTRQSSI
ncbi:Uncharacterised protein g6906 [Pycnogonum litorale]